MDHTTAQNSPKELIQEAYATLATIKEIIAKENAIMSGHKTKQRIEELEHTLPEKKKLSIRLERILNLLKHQKEQIQSDPQLKAGIVALDKSISDFKNDAITNLNKLRAAHQLRADFIRMVKDTVMKLDANQTYGATGSMSDNTGPVRTVMGKNV